MTITNEELKEKQIQEFIKILRNATPEGKNYIQITLVAAAQSIGETGVSLIRDIINSESQQRAKAHMVFEPFLVQRSSTKPLSSAESPQKE